MMPDSKQIEPPGRVKPGEVLEECVRCVHFTPKRATGYAEGIRGLCRRYPPVATDERADHLIGRDEGRLSIYPTVDSEGLCGEFVPRPEAP